jgi:hypothetical protein
MDLELLEALALSDDRGPAIARLLPGSEDSDYYRVLHAQHRGALDEADAILTAWPERHGRTPRHDRLRLRQLLYRATVSAIRVPDAAADQLRDRFAVNHRHEAEVELDSATRSARPARPSRLPEAAFDPAALLRQAVDHDANLSQVSDEGMFELIDPALEQPLDPARRRALLGRLSHTAQPQLVGMIADELAQRTSSGFGSLAIHRELTLDQLHAVARLRPELHGHADWVAAVVMRMRPAHAVDLALDLAVRARYVAELWRFASVLPPTANSLKAHVLWHLFDTQRRRGAEFDGELFRIYLALPRAAGYLARGRSDRVGSAEAVQLGADFSVVTGLPPAGSDEQLIRDALYQQPGAAESYAAWLDRSWLDGEIATAQLLLGDPELAERATGVLGPARAQALRDRVELAWCAHNPTRFAADASIALEVDVKNVSELVVKVFRIDPLAYFQHHHREVDAAIDLDGLAASHERVMLFAEPAIRRVRRRIELPSCARPGSYVIDLIGNGISSRAVIHKGRLRHAMRIGAAGHVITVVDAPGELGDAGQSDPATGPVQPRRDARVWLGDREYLPDGRGAVVVPFATSPARTAMLIVAGDIATVSYIELVAESCELALALALDRQSLTAGRSARAIARLSLSIGGAPASLALIKHAVWEVALTDRRGLTTAKSHALALDDRDAAVLEWSLGDDTAEISITVRGRIEVVSEQREREVSARRSIRVAAMYAGTAIEALYLTRSDTGWVISALGRTGEPRAHRPIAIAIVHRWTQVAHTAELASDALGRVELGPLPGARRITATLGSATQSWELDEPTARPVVLHAVAGRDVIVHLPTSRTAGEVLRHASLIELGGNLPAHHAVASFEPLAGAIAIRGLAPGDYQLRGHGLPPIAIEITPPSAELAGWAIAPTELIELPRAAPAIAAIAVARDQPGPGELRVALRGADPRTRVHVIATRFAPAPVEPFNAGPIAAPQRRGDAVPGARYVSGRELGDEYRYVLERRSAPRFPGVMLDKPSLLLNPWPRRTTTTRTAPPRPGGSFAPSPAGPATSLGRSAAAAPPTGSGDSFVGYDFLAEPPVVLANLAADPSGQLRVPLAQLAGASTVTVIVDDPAGRSCRRIALAEPAHQPRDLRLMLALEPMRHATQRKAIAALDAGDHLVIEDLATAQLHLIDSVERAHGYLLALRDEPMLREFAFITRWHALDPAERRALYSKYACHELHLFLYHKDREFFDQVIRPHLIHKRSKAFLDHWLLGAELAPYLEPARFARLNAVERALLAARLAPDPAIPRLFDDEVAAQPPAPDRDARLIDALLRGATLDRDDRAGPVSPTPAPPSPAPPTSAPPSPASHAEAALTARMPSASVTPVTAPGAPAAVTAGGAVAAGGSGTSAETLRLPKRVLGKRGDDEPPPGELELDRDRRSDPPAAFRAIDRTQEWAETQWWRLTPAQSGPAMIGGNRLWRDLAHHPMREPSSATGFVSPWLGLATGSFAEAMSALAVTDLPFVAAGHAISSDGARLSLAAAGRALVGSSQLVEGELVTGGTALVVGMTYVRADDRYDWSGGEQVDKYATSPLAVGVVYTCQVVVANPTSSRQRVAALVQIPRGSIAVAGARPTQTIDVLLEPYGTHGHEVSFYFPAPGPWSHFPVHVSRAGQIVAAAPGRTLEVQDGGAAPDPRSWPSLSQRGSVAEVVDYLATANLAAIDLVRVAWRLRDRAAYDAILAALEARRGFDATLWGYALLHRDAPRIRAWLRARGRDLLSAGPVLDMLGLDAEDLGGYEHLEFAPLIHARAHRQGGKLRILNDGLAAQYARFLDLVAHRPAATAQDLLAAAHYLLAQDRMTAALEVLARLAPRLDPDGEAAIAERMQYDYLAGYAACLTGELDRARQLAQRWCDYPVERWQARFAALADLLEQVDGGAPAVSDLRSREQRHAELAAAQPAFDLAVDRDGVVVHSQRVAQLELRFFEMDIELLFSRQPFVHSDVSRFSYIEPGHREPLFDPPAQYRIAWPDRLRDRNVVIEAVGAGLRKAKVHYANDLITNLAHQVGQIRVQRGSDHRALAATYIKVYARRTDGSVAFYKDGYTDLRGWFDYASLSTTELDAVERFAILVHSDHAGAAILEIEPPAR